MSLVLAQKNTHIEESNWLTNPKVGQFDSSMWVFFGTRATLIKWVKLTHFLSQCTYTNMGLKIRYESCYMFLWTFWGNPAGPCGTIWPSFEEWMVGVERVWNLLLFQRWWQMVHWCDRILECRTINVNLMVRYWGFDTKYTNVLTRYDLGKRIRSVLVGPI